MWFPVALVTPTDFTPIPPCKTKENNNKRDIYKYDLIRCQLVLNEIRYLKYLEQSIKSDLSVSKCINWAICNRYDFCSEYAWTNYTAKRQERKKINQSFLLTTLTTVS